jgi:translocation and assembly module TamA
MTAATFSTGREASTGEAARVTRAAGRRRVAAALRAAMVLAVLSRSGQAAAEVQLVGVDGALAANVLAYLTLDQESCEAPAWRVQQQYVAAPARIESALQALGYYAASVKSELVTGKDCWRATFTIDPGKPIRIRELDVKAEGDPIFAVAAAQSSLREGAVLDQGAYDALKRRWSDLAIERGYRDAKFLESRIDVYPDEHAADIVLHFDAGERYRFGAIRLDQSVLSDRLVRAYVPFKAGDLYDGRLLTTLYVALADSGYFQTIDIRQGEPDRETREVPIEIALTAAKRRLVTYGAGFSTDTGPRLRFGRTNRRFNDRGHQFGINAQLSPVISEVTASYRFPHGDPRTEWINFDVGLKKEDTDTSKSDSLEFGAQRVVERPHNWTRTQKLGLLIEDFDVADQSGRSTLLMSGIDWARTRADNALRPHRGYRLDFEVRGASDALLSDTSFVQAIAAGKWIWSLPGMGRVLVRGRVGATDVGSFADLPPSVRFFAGGDNSVRGYDFQTLGPTDDSGKVIGGSSLATASFEYEHPLHERWSLAFFVDSGNAFEGSHFTAKTGAGLGGRWQSPLGPIRIDLAHPFDDPTTSWRVHISLGPDL